MLGRRVLSRGCWAPVSCTANSPPPPRYCASSDEFSLQDLPESPSWPFSTPYDITPLDIFFCNELTLCWLGRHNREALDEQPRQDHLGRAIEGRHLQGTRRCNCGTQVLLAISRSWVCCRLQGTDMAPPPPPSHWHGQGWLVANGRIYVYRSCNESTNTAASPSSAIISACTTVTSSTIRLERAPGRRLCTRPLEGLLPPIIPRWRKDI